MSLALAKSPPPSRTQGPQTMCAAGAGARNSSFVLLAIAMLAIGLDVGVARISYGVVLPAFARDLQLSLTAAGLLGTLHLVGYLSGSNGVRTQLKV
jgi:cyanate permease